MAAVNAFVLLAALTLAVGAMPAPDLQPPPDVDALMMRIGDRVAEFYKRAATVICIETSRVQPVDYRSAPEGFARTVESELRLEADASQANGEAAVVRKIRKVNGRAPREKDKKDRDACTDPNPLSSEPLAFLLPAHRPEYQFKTAGMTKDRNRPALMIDFATVDRRSNAQLIEDPTGHEDCFDWTGHIASRGRIWADAQTYDVIRVERSLGGPVDLRVSAPIQRRYRMESWMALLRDDVTIRYETVSFSDPDEELLLPESISMVTVVQGGLQSTRRDQTFSNYQRFVTGGRVLR